MNSDQHPHQSRATKSLRHKAREACRARAEALVSRMTLEEKVSQMCHEAPAIPRLGIPSYNWWCEALHGVGRAGTATVFPQAIGLAASFDPELVEKVGDVISTEARAKFHASQRAGDHDIYKGLTFWSPNINIFRDPRWGRGHETYGEDPHLTGELGVAFVRGMQGDDETCLKTATCLKHFAVHSGPEGTRHGFNAEVSQKDLHETYLQAFEHCVRETDVEGVMGAYNAINGLPSCANKPLMQDLLRDTWHFEGYYVSDCGAIYDIYHFLKTVPTRSEAAAMAIDAGCDLNCGDSYLSVLDAVHAGALDEAKITESVTRLFTTRFLLGLDPQPTSDEGAASGAQADSVREVRPYTHIPYTANDHPEHRAFNRKVAADTLVLLKNDGLLPLSLAEDGSEPRTIGIIGPNANNRRALVGNYEGTSSRYVTVLDAFQNWGEETGHRILYSEGCDLFRDRHQPIGLAGVNDLLGEAKAVCEASDLVIAVMGLDAGLEGEQGDQNNAFGSGDKYDLELPGKQRELLEAVYASGKPVILVVLSGSAIALDEDAEHARAILQGWYPGAEGGSAILDILLGKASPQAKLPLSFYSRDYAIPDFEDYSMKDRTYRFHRGQVLYPFGFGLSYSRCELSDVEVMPRTRTELLEGEEDVYDVERTSDPRATVTVRAHVRNTGDYPVRETVQVYVKAPENAPPFPVLKGLAKCELEPGESRVVAIELDRYAFMVYDDEGRRYMPQGTFELSVGFSQNDPRSIELMGQAPQVVTLDL